MCDTYPSLARNVEQAEAARTDTLARLGEHLLQKHFGRLVQFFGKVKERALTVAADEVKFAAKYSKQEALRVARDFGPAAVERALARTLKSLAKRLSSANRQPDAVVSVLWREYAALLTRKYAAIEALMGECYAAALPVTTAALETLLAAVWEAYVQQHASPAAPHDFDATDIEDLSTAS